MLAPTILYEDKHLLVIDKPSGIVVNRAQSVRGETLQDWIEKYLKNLNTKHQTLNKSKITSSNVSNRSEPRNWDLEFARRAGIVHRLDKETSGVLLIAKTPNAFKNLQKQFKSRKVKKTYLALVHGKVDTQEGVIKTPVGRLPWNRERFGVLPNGHPAETAYKVTAYLRVEEKKSDNMKSKINNRWNLTNGKYSFLEIFPKTGRTHQIRVHLKSIGHPVVGDTFYAGRKRARQDRKWCPRLFLHASKIEFTDPTTKKTIRIEAQLPDDLNKVILNLVLVKED